MSSVFQCQGALLISATCQPLYKFKFFDTHATGLLCLTYGLQTVKSSRYFRPVLPVLSVTSHTVYHVFIKTADSLNSIVLLPPCALQMALPILHGELHRAAYPFHGTLPAILLRAPLYSTVLFSAHTYPGCSYPSSLLHQ